MAQPTANEIEGARNYRKAETKRRPHILKLHGQYEKGLITAMECITQSLKVINDIPIETLCTRFHEADD